MTSLSRRFTAALCASTMALSISPAFAHASNTAASDDSATSSTSIPGYPRDEFGGLRSKTSDKWGMPNQGVGGGSSRIVRRCSVAGVRIGR